jgi:uncharacterized membrane protein YkvA (DUF1232 family)
VAIAVPGILWQLIVGVALALVLGWVLLVVVLWRSKPAEITARHAARILPDVLGLIARLARDRAQPTRIRVYLWLLLAYLAMPFDIVPDVIPVIGYVDDVIVVALALRAVVRASGVDAVRHHWHGTDNGFAALLRVCQLSVS